MASLGTRPTTATDNRTPAVLAGTLERNLLAYAAAAAAGLMTMAAPSHAAVVVTQTNLPITFGATLDFDIDNNGTNDIRLRERTGYCSNTLTARGLENMPANGIAIDNRYELGGAAALKPGARIGDSRIFVSYTSSLYQGPVLAQHCKGPKGTYGYFPNAGPRFLGFRFFIDRQLHYGWMRVEVQESGAAIRGLVTGYAYETTPNQPIRAGQTQDTDESSVPPDAATAVPKQSPKALSLRAMAFGRPAR